MRKFWLKNSKKFHKWLKKEHLSEETLKKAMLLIGGIFVMSLAILFQLSNSGLAKNLQSKSDEVPQKVSGQLTLERKINKMVEGYPIEDMTPLIARKDPQVAAFLIGIAKKESNWGKRVPVLDGKDCFNYWGYRGIRDRMGTDGHTCFDNPRQAVNTVSKRLSYFIKEKDFDTPEELVVWKCGFDCEAQDSESVDKWIEDVDLYYEQVIN
jgi:hypothetical protein